MTHESNSNRAPAAPSNRINVPQNADQAHGMVVLGMAFLKEHAPERLAAPVPASTLTADEQFAKNTMIELARMGASPVGLSLAAQLFGVGACAACGYRKLYCRCEAVPASTGREPIDVEFKRLADTILQATTNGARLEAIRSMAALFDSLAAPVAARELDADAERRAVEFDDLTTYPSPHGTLVRLADVKCRVWSARATAESAPASAAPRVAEKEFEPCKNAMIRNGVQAIPKSCPRCGLSKTCPRDDSPVGAKEQE